MNIQNFLFQSNFQSQKIDILEQYNLQSLLDDTESLVDQHTNDIQQDFQPNDSNQNFKYIYDIIQTSTNLVSNKNLEDSTKFQQNNPQKSPISSLQCLDNVNRFLYQSNSKKNNKKKLYSEMVDAQLKLSDKENFFNSNRQKEKVKHKIDLKEFFDIDMQRKVLQKIQQKIENFNQIQILKYVLLLD